MFLSWWQRYLERRSELNAIEEEIVRLKQNLYLAQSEANYWAAIGRECLDQEAHSRSRCELTVDQIRQMDTDSYEALAAYEQSRTRATLLWQRMQAAEQLVEEARAGGLSQHKAEKLRMRWQQCRDEYQRMTTAKINEWKQVETLWREAAKQGYIANERKARTGHHRSEADKAFTKAEQYHDNAVEFGRRIESRNERILELNQQLELARREAERDFVAIAGDDFLYWPKDQTSLAAWCIALVDSGQTEGQPVVAGSIYECDRYHGVASIRPVKNEH